MLLISNFILLLIKTKRRKTLSCPHPPSTITVVQVLVKEVPEIKANNYHPSPRHHPYNSSLRSTNPGRVTNSHSQRFFIKSRKYWSLNSTYLDKFRSIYSVHGVEAAANAISDAHERFHYRWAAKWKFSTCPNSWFITVDWHKICQ